MDNMMAAHAMGHPAFYYQDSRHFAHHPAMQHHMPMYTLPSTPVYARPSSACSQPMVPTLYSNAPSAMTPMGSPSPMAHKPSMLDTEVCPSTPPLSTSGSVISSPGACDMLQTPMNPMFSGLDGIDGLKAEFESETTLIQEWNSGCASPPMTPVYLGQQQAKVAAINSSFSSDLLSTASCPSLSPSPSPYARSVASTDEDVSFCDPRNLTVGSSSPSTLTLAPEFPALAALADEELRSASAEAAIQPTFDFDAAAITHGLPTFDALSELDSDEDFSQLISLPASSDLRRPRACTGSSVVSLSHSFVCDDDLYFEEPFQVEYMPSPPCSGSEDDGHEAKRIKKCNGLKAAPCKINMAAGSADSTTSTQEAGNQAAPADSKSPSSSEGSTPLPAPVNRRGRKQSLTEDPSKTFVCDICFRRFRRQEHLKRHYRSLHTQDKPFECNECGKKFSRSDNLAQHARTHGSGAIVMDILDEATMHNMAMLGHHHPDDFHNMGKVLFQVAAEIPGSASELSSEDGMSDHGRKKRKRSD